MRQIVQYQKVGDTHMRNQLPNGTRSLAILDKIRSSFWRTPIRTSEKYFSTRASEENLIRTAKDFDSEKILRAAFSNGARVKQVDRSYGLH